MREPGQTEATKKILDIAEQLAQTFGFNAFSYADIAVQLGVTKASLHYHFPSKAELGRALIVRYLVKFTRELEAIDRRETGALAKLRGYVGLFNQVMCNDRMCLCGMFAAEYATLPPAMQEELRAFFDTNERWLSRILHEGLGAGEFVLRESPQERARVLLSTLEGAMLIARAYADDTRFQAVAEHLLTALMPTHPDPSPSLFNRKPGVLR